MVMQISSKNLLEGRARILRYMYSKEPRLLLFALFIYILKSFTYVVGIAIGTASFVKIKMFRTR